MAELLNRGVPVLAFKDLVSTADTRSGSYELPQCGNSRVNNVTVVQYVPTGVPSALNLVVEGAMRDVDAEYVALGSFATPGVPGLVTTSSGTRFIRVHQVSRTGGAGINVYIMVA